jgi:glycerol kinase
MSEVVLALDQGTSSTRCFVFDRDLRVRGAASRPVRTNYPEPGWVEQDPEEIFLGAVESLHEALDRSGSGWGDVRAVGIDNQTETFVVWDRATGTPIHPAIVWQCRRTADQCERLRAAGHEPTVRARTGLELDPSFSATKLGWVLEHVPEARARAEAGELAFGDVASWLLWRLSEGAAHLTEPSNASRSMLLSLDSLDWDPELLELFGIPKSLLPGLHPSGSRFVETGPDRVGARVPIAGALGDQQAALFGQACWTPGMTKVTLGTGAFVWTNAGPKPPDPPYGILATCAWRMEDETAYALEGFIPVAGAVVSWLVDVGVIGGPQETEVLAAEDRGEDVWFVPALAGLGAPQWDPNVRGALLGVVRGTGRPSIVRAALDGVVHQLADALEAMDEGVPGGIPTLRLDGGMAGNAWLCQRLADIAGRVVERPANTEASGLGAAAVAGLTVGFWESRQELGERWALDRRFEPRLSDAGRARLREGWKRAVELVRSWP